MLRDSVAAVRARGPVAPPAELLALLGQLDLTALDDASFAALLPAAGLDPSPGAGTRMAGVNRLLDGLPPQLRDRLATRFLSALYSPYLDAPGG